MNDELKDYIPVPSQVEIAMMKKKLDILNQHVGKSDVDKYKFTLPKGCHFDFGIWTNKYVIIHSEIGTIVA